MIRAKPKSHNFTCDQYTRALIRYQRSWSLVTVLNSRRYTNLRKWRLGWQENIFGFQVTVDDTLGVQMLQGNKNLQSHDNYRKRSKHMIQQHHGLSPCMTGEISYLRDEVLGDTFWEATFRTWQNHLQHVTLQLFHDDKNLHMTPILKVCQHVHVIIIIENTFTSNQ